MCSMRWAWLSACALAFAASTAVAEAPRILPILSQDSGRIEALLLLDEHSPTDSVRALDRVLTPSMSLAGGGLRLQFGQGGQITTDLSLDEQPGLALLCRGNIGLAVALGSLGEHCLLADVGSGDPLLASTVGRETSIEGVWRSASNTFDVRFGLSWLDTATAAGAGPFAEGLLPGGVSFDGPTAPSIVLGPLAIESRQLTLSGTGWIGERAWVRVDGSSARSFASSGWLGGPLRWESTSLSLGGGYGAFSGTLTGRLIEIPSEAQSSFDLDLGVSWRTPWRARLTVGARNLLGQPDATQWPLYSLPHSADSDTRTPYVRYHQDL